MKSLHIAMPVKDGVVGPCVASLISLAAELGAEGVRVTCSLPWQGTILPRLRYEILKSAVENKSDRILWIDSDIVFAPAHARVLLAVDEDLVSGVYRLKKPGGAAVGTPIALASYRSDPLLEMHGVGFGFLSMSRSCASAMLQRHGALAFVQADAHASESIGDDHAFCERWRRDGGRIYVHTGVRVGHVGLHVFGGDE